MEFGAEKHGIPVTLWLYPLLVFHPLLLHPLLLLHSGITTAPRPVTERHV